MKNTSSPTFVNGDFAHNLSRRLDAVVADPPDVITVLIGTNDARASLADYPVEVLEHVYRVNVVAPLALAQIVLPHMPEGGRIVNVTSDAGVEPYPRR